MFSDERGAELRQLFFESAQELLQTLNDEALKLEQQPGDVEVMRSIRRAVHTLKGDAAACGFRELSDSAHELEDALALENLSKEVSLVELAFTAADTFEAMLAAYQHNVTPPHAAPLHKMIAALVAGPAQDSHVRNKKAAAECDLTRSGTAFDSERQGGRTICIPGYNPDRPKLRHAHCRTPVGCECTAGDRGNTGGARKNGRQEPLAILARDPAYRGTHQSEMPYPYRIPTVGDRGRKSHLWMAVRVQKPSPYLQKQGCPARN